MDTSLQNLLDSIMQEEGVKGVLVTDEQGLCLATRGIASVEAASFIAAISDRAAELSRATIDTNDSSNNTQPTIRIEAGNNTYPFSRMITIRL
ncbi:hypothetical protein BDF19DRAFT_422112 [Syncephalis fuscata]|nr:hypothetical protein BDF19DRAFT_422112 [Syncephalis fuscata]